MLYSLQQDAKRLDLRALRYRNVLPKMRFRLNSSLIGAYADCLLGYVFDGHSISNDWFLIKIIAIVLVDIGGGVRWQAGGF